MASFNKVILMGNLTRDPELRVTPTGLNICKFGLAVNRVYSDREGNRQEETTFVDVDAFGKQAETIGRYMTKGRPILVEGRLRLDTWETQNGEKRSKLGVVVENFQFVGGRDDSGGGYSDSGSRGYEDSSPPQRQSNRQGSGSGYGPRQAPPSSANSGDNVEDDVPF